MSRQDDLSSLEQEQTTHREDTHHVSYAHSSGESSHGSVHAHSSGESSHGSAHAHSSGESSHGSAHAHSSGESSHGSAHAHSSGESSHGSAHAHSSGENSHGSAHAHSSGDSTHDSAEGSHRHTHHSASAHSGTSRSGSRRSAHSSSRSGSHSSEHSASAQKSAVEEQRRTELIQKYQVVSDEDIQREKQYAHHRHHHHHHSRRRKVRRTLIAVLCVPLALILIAASVVGVLSLVGRMQVREDTTGIQTNPYAVTYDEGKTVEYNGQVYALNEDIVSVAAIGLDREQFGLLGDKIGTAGQADMILIAAMDMRTGLVRTLMIPRDTMVDVDQYTTVGEYVRSERMQICLSFAYGDGKQTSSNNVLKSVERVLYGIPVSLYGVLDLDGIAALNDAIGGVSLTLQAPYGSYYAGDRITLHGMEAQAFVRSRDLTILESDTYRRARQVQYLHAFTDKAVHAATKDIGVVRRLYNAAMEYAFTNVSLSRVMYFATTLLAKGVEVMDPVVLAGQIQRGDPYSEYILDEQSVFETVLDIFYTPVGA